MGFKTHARAFPNTSQTTGLGSDTDSNSKAVMLRGEYDDVVHIEKVISSAASTVTVPSEFTILQRQQTYYGPELELTDNDCRWLLTAPAPDTQLLLWQAIETSTGYIEGWERVAEVKASLKEPGQYDICPQCGNPIKTIEHEREAAIGICQRR